MKIGKWKTQLTHSSGNTQPYNTLVQTVTRTMLPEDRRGEVTAPIVLL